MIQAVEDLSELLRDMDEQQQQQGYVPADPDDPNTHWKNKLLCAKLQVKV
jgi:hypothetical protein